MLYGCNFCGGRAKISWSFKISTADAVGFFFLSLVLIIPIGLISYLWTFSFSDGGMVFISLGATAMFCFTFYKIGKPVYRFFSMFVNFSFHAEFNCRECGKLTKTIKIGSIDAT